MNKEITAYYNATSKNNSQHIHSLPFEIPVEKKGNLSNIKYFRTAWLDEHRLYIESGLRWQIKLVSIWNLLWAAVAIIIGTILAASSIIAIFHPANKPIPFSYSLSLIIPALVITISSSLAKKGRRKACTVFERDTSKIYIWDEKDKPHLVANFYDQYFFINEYGTLFIRPRVKQADGSFKTYPSVQIAWGGSNTDGMDAWYCLLRFMDKTKPFNDDEKEVFDYVKKRKEKLGYKTEGINWPDGTKELF